MERFWAHSIRVASLAGAIATHLEDVDPDEAHTYVLFRDCGMLVMLRKFPPYADIMAQGNRIPGAQLTRIEDARFKWLDLSGTGGPPPRNRRSSCQGDTFAPNSDTQPE